MLLILVVTCSEIAVVLCYFQLCNEDYEWWWRSFLTAGSSGFYLFAYSIMYFFTQVRSRGGARATPRATRQAPPTMCTVHSRACPRVDAAGHHRLRADAHLLHLHVRLRYALLRHHRHHRLLLVLLVRVGHLRRHQGRLAAEPSARSEPGQRGGRRGGITPREVTAALGARRSDDVFCVVCACDRVVRCVRVRVGRAWLVVGAGPVLPLRHVWKMAVAPYLPSATLTEFAERSCTEAMLALRRGAALGARVAGRRTLCAPALSTETLQTTIADCKEKMESKYAAPYTPEQLSADLETGSVDSSALKEMFGFNETLMKVGQLPLQLTLSPWLPASIAHHPPTRRWRVPPPPPLRGAIPRPTPCRFRPQLTDRLLTARISK